MTDKLHIYTDVVTRLMGETAACTPASWTKGSLRIECDGVRINYWLKNPDEPGTAEISEKLRDLIDELYVRMSGSGDVWTEAAFNFWREKDDLKFESKFQYPQRPESPKEKSKWKFWQ